VRCQQAGPGRSSIHAASAGGASGAWPGAPVHVLRPELGLRGASRQGLAGVRLARHQRDERPELALGAPARGGRPKLGSRSVARARGSTSAGRTTQLGGGRPELRCPAWLGIGEMAARQHARGARRNATG
jgi:hypothetical protein